KVHHPDHVERVVERVQRSWDTGEPWEDTFPLRGADGKYRWFLSRALPIQNAEGRVFRWFGTNTDVTELREAEEKLRLQAEELEKRVAERTRELQQANGALLRDMEERQKLEEQLLQSRKMESIGTLAGGIAHDFNNVLNIIQGYTFVLRDHAAQNKDMKESLNIIEQSVQRGAALVQQILTFARKSSAHFEPVNVNLLIETAIGLIGQTFPKTIELSSSLDPDVAPIMADKNQIQQALLNLCLNARDAMPNGGKLLFETGVIDGTTLQRLGEAKEKRYVSIHITDTGTGMDEKLQRRIFEPFFTTKDKGVGTGLGLSVVYGIVKNHNGVIHLDSQPRSGTSFRLHFPAVDGDLTAKEAVALDFSDVAAAREISATVLLVEDEKRMLDLLDKILLRHGYKVLKASDGETAVEVYRRNRDKIDVVLLDMGLPKMAGQEVLLKLKQENPAVKAVVASGYLEPELRSELKRAGVDYFLHKPYKSDEVVKTLGSLTARE
ncbi:MAG TPA: ATP-binding protein, partial [Terriglobales bacterium]|nr:ATP-binding protein [Terriglobales bacterium]